MSGRVRVRQPDGRVTTGYRKTPRINQRRTPEERAEIKNLALARRFASAWRMRLSFALPQDVLISDGNHGIGVEVFKGWMHISADSTCECYAKAKTFIVSIAEMNMRHLNIVGAVRHLETNKHYTCILSYIPPGDEAWLYVTRRLPRVY